VSVHRPLFKSFISREYTIFLNDLEKFTEEDFEKIASITVHSLSNIVYVATLPYKKAINLHNTSQDYLLVSVFTKEEGEEVLKATAFMYPKSETKVPKYPISGIKIKPMLFEQVEQLKNS